MIKSQFTLNQLWLDRQRQASIIAHEALHNVFTLIEPRFLQIKNYQEKLIPENSLGIETYRTMLDLGFWKKLVYLGLESKTSLQLCYKYFDHVNFTLLRDFVESFTDEQLKQVAKWENELVLREFWLRMCKKIHESEHSEVVKNIN